MIFERSEFVEIKWITTVPGRGGSEANDVVRDGEGTERLEEREEQSGKEQRECPSPRRKELQLPQFVVNRETNDGERKFPVAQEHHLIDDD